MPTSDALLLEPGRADQPEAVLAEKALAGDDATPYWRKSPSAAPPHPTPLGLNACFLGHEGITRGLRDISE